MDEDSAPTSPSSLKTKLKNSLCFSCCFRRLPNRQTHRQVPDSPSSPPPSDEKPALLWLKTRAPQDLKDEIKDKCLTIFGRNGRHKRHASAEFRYDPLSYSLNFEDGFDDDDEYPLRNFSARLPPPQPVRSAPLREITAN